jgi:chemotaxis protein CheX
VDVKTINPVLEALAGTLPQLGFQKVEKQGVQLTAPVLACRGVMINIGVLGSLRGSILIGMDVESAKRFASVMMMGMAVTELDELAQSAISEMGNMVCANACTRFSEAGIEGLDISPPVLLVGEGGRVTLAVPKVIAVNFAVDGISVDVYVGLSDAGR